MTTYPLPTLGPTITDAGITIPSFEDILASLQASFRAIYGQDTDLAEDTQDGVFLSLIAQAQYDTNDGIATTFMAFSPTYAQGVQLSSLVKINGLRRESPTNSTAPVLLTGQAGVTIQSGIVQDGFGNQWTLPPNLTFPGGGTISSTLTCQTPGSITLSSGSTTDTAGGLTFVTVIPGWQIATTTSDATTGQPVEDDSELRQRQAISTGLPAQTPLESILAAVANTAGVTDYAIYENDANTTDSNGVPAHSISLVVAGGLAQAIATVIAEKKNPGTGTYGSTSQVVVDPTGVPNTINFFILAGVNAYFILGLHPLAGYLSTTGQIAINAVAAALSGLVIGETAYVNKLFGAANLSGDAALSVGGGLTQQQLDALSITYNITYIHLGTAPSPGSQADIPILFNQEIVCSPANGSITLT